MTTAEFAVLPTLPDSVAEWEDLLVRLEIASRAVRVTLEEVGEGESASRALAAAVEREEEVARALEAAAGFERSQPPPGPGSVDAGVTTLALRFVSIRSRNFAMVQRRGLEVWGWKVPPKDGSPVTVYQLLTWLARQDADLLAELRAARRTGRL